MLVMKMLRAFGLSLPKSIGTLYLYQKYNKRFTSLKKTPTASDSTILVFALKRFRY